MPSDNAGKQKPGRPKGCKNKKPRVTKLPKLKRIPLPKEDLENIALKRSKSREKYPWDLILATYLTPELNEKNEPQWFTFLELAERFNVPIANIRQRSSAFGWVQQQLQAEKEFWEKRREAALNRMARKLPIAQEKAFDTSLQQIEQLGTYFNPEELRLLPEDQGRIAGARAKCLDTVYSATGVSMPKTLENTNVFAVHLRQKDEKMVVGPDGRLIEASQRSTLLELWQTRILGNGQEEDSL
jgi:hypothetical protein